jgi:hypothetical protein
VRLDQALEGARLVRGVAGVQPRPPPESDPAAPYLRERTSGVVTKVPIPSGSDANDLTIGPDNALWYTEGTGRRIARLIP